MAITLFKGQSVLRMWCLDSGVAVFRSVYLAFGSFRLRLSCAVDIIVNWFVSKSACCCVYRCVCAATFQFAMISFLPRWLNNCVAFQWAAHLTIYRNNLRLGTKRVFVAALRKYQLGKGGRVRSSVFDILAALLRRVAVYNDWIIACRGGFNLWVSHEHTEHRLVSRSGSVLETLEVPLPVRVFEAEGFSIP